MSSVAGIYERLVFPEAPADRPTAFINMVATIDGKTVTGTRQEDVFDLGSKNDHALMRRIEDQADGVIIGANTVRAAPASWDPRTAFRLVVTRSGDIDWAKRYFTGEGRAFVASPAESAVLSPPGVESITYPREVDFRALLRRMREMGCERLLCFGGSELNAQLLKEDLVDELFLTIAPKVKLGRDVPTYAGGDPLPREAMLRFSLIEHHVVDDEVFLRYRKRRG